ncbi:MAG: hypothetical protein PHG23_01395 [Candidatus Pacebacteria bacterium]|nr:hypothetical protein [Candidatus Paceibacterota bacterium]
MDLNEIKKLIREEGAKVIITDEKGEALIIMDYEDYKRIRQPKAASAPEKAAERPAVKARIEEEQPEELEDEPLKIDDLPF